MPVGIASICNAADPFKRPFYGWRGLAEQALESLNHIETPRSALLCSASTAGLPLTGLAMPLIFSRLRLCLAVTLGLGLLSACAGPRSGSLFDILKPYRAEVVQGNVITREQAALIKPGMSRAQVRDILGSPMVADIFHESRWDYVFTIHRPGAAVQQRNVVVRFEGDRLISIDAPELPSEREFVASIDAVKSSGKVPTLELTPEQIKALPAPAAEATPQATVPPGPPRTYPPLEPR